VQFACITAPRLQRSAVPEAQISIQIKRFYFLPKVEMSDLDGPFTLFGMPAFTFYLRAVARMV
jgi:hypothetical protein